MSCLSRLSSLAKTKLICQSIHSSSRKIVPAKNIQPWLPRLQHCSYATHRNEKADFGRNNNSTFDNIHKGWWFCGAVATIAFSWWYGNYGDKPLATLQAAEKIDKPGEKVITSRRKEYNFIADVVQEVASSLVYIEIKDLGVSDYFTGLPVTSSNGSGFIVEANGLILTNAHVVINKPRASVQVRLQDGRTFTGIVEDVDVKSDLATVRIPCKGLSVMPLGSSSGVRPGEFVIAMGSPLSLSNTITTGVVSTPSRQKSELGLQGRDVPEYIQTDAAITFGNSGGPLVNLDGEAIGINSMKVTPGISFAIPIDYAKEFLKRSAEANKGQGVNKKGSTRSRRYIGITMLTINSQIIEELKHRLEFPSSVRHGIVVFKIVRGSPADRAGLLPGDIVTHINGSPIHSSRDVYKLLESEGDLEMKVVRKNTSIVVRVRPDVPIQ